MGELDRKGFEGDAVFNVMTDSHLELFIANASTTATFTFISCQGRSQEKAEVMIPTARQALFLQQKIQHTKNTS